MCFVKDCVTRNSSTLRYILNIYCFFQNQCLNVLKGEEPEPSSALLDLISVKTIIDEKNKC